MPQIGGPAVPAGHLRIDPPDTLTVGIEKRDGVLRSNLPLLGRLAHQPRRLVFVQRHALPARIQVRETVLPGRVALLGREPIPPRRLGGIGGNASTAKVRIAHRRLRRRVALLRPGEQRLDADGSPSGGPSAGAPQAARARPATTMQPNRARSTHARSPERPPSRADPLISAP